MKLITSRRRRTATEKKQEGKFLTKRRHFCFCCQQKDKTVQWFGPKNQSLPATDITPTLAQTTFYLFFLGKEKTHPQLLRQKIKKLSFLSKSLPGRTVATTCSYFETLLNPYRVETVPISIFQFGYWGAEEDGNGRRPERRQQYHVLEGTPLKLLTQKSERWTAAASANRQ